MSRRHRRLAVALSVSIAALGWPSASRAQVHWDAGWMAGATERVTSAARAPTALPGPSAQLEAHVALLPLLRVGVYTIFDLSPAPDTAARQVYAVGLRAKVTPPLLRAPWRAWFYVGGGAADAYSPGPPVRGSVGMLELPVGVGLGHRLRGPWELIAELGARLVVFQGRLTGAEESAVSSAPLVRNDLLAVSLSVGVSWSP